MNNLSRSYCSFREDGESLTTSIWLDVPDRRRQSQSLDLCFELNENETGILILQLYNTPKSPFLMEQRF